MQTIGTVMTLMATATEFLGNPLVNPPVSQIVTSGNPQRLAATTAASGRANFIPSHSANATR